MQDILNFMEFQHRFAVTISSLILNFLARTQKCDLFTDFALEFRSFSFLYTHKIYVIWLNEDKVAKFYMNLTEASVVTERR